MDDLTKAIRKRAGRSPSYPGIDLETAFKRIEEFYDNAQHHYSHIKSVAEHWGYTPGSGSVNTTIAALIKYGFLVDEGKGDERRVRLSELALDIVKDKRDDTSERNQKLTKAAFSPEIHKEMHQTYGDNLPSDSDILYELERKRKFTPNGAREFLAQYKNTLEFVLKLGSSITPTLPREGKGEQQEAEANNQAASDARTGGTDVVPTPPSKEEGVRTVTIPMLEGVWATLTAQFPMTKGDWDYMIKILQAMEPNLVKGKSQSQEVEIDEESKNS